MRSAFIVVLALGSLLFVPNETLCDSNKNKSEKHLKKGHKLYDKGDFDKATSEFRQAYDLNPDFEILYHIGQSEAGLENNRKALSYYNQYLEQAGNKVPLGRRATLQNEIERLEKLVGQNEAKTQADPNLVNRERAEKRFEKGLKLYSANQYKRAAAAFEEAYELYPNWKFLYETARTAAKLSQNGKAVNTYKRCLKEGGSEVARHKSAEAKREINRLESLMKEAEAKDKSRHHYTRGVDLYNRGEYEEAADEIKTAYDLDSRYEILFKLGQAEAKAEHYSKALQAYNRYLEKGHSNISKRQRAQVDKQIKRLTDAEAEQTKRKEALKLHKKGLKLSKKGEHEKALSEYNRAYELYSSYKFLYSIGASAAERKDYEAAISAYSRYLQDGKNKISSEKRYKVESRIEKLRSEKQLGDSKKESLRHFKLGSSLKKRRQYKEALNEFKTAYKLYSNYKILFSIAKTLALLKKNSMAIEAYNRYMDEGGSKIPSTRRAKIDKEIARLRLISSAHEKRDESSRHFKTGLALMAKKKFDQAIYEFETAYDLDQNYEILYPLAKSSVAVEQNKKAFNTYDRYLSKGGNKIPKKRRAEVRREIQRLYPLVHNTK
ncbi:MAG: tetratricopeptide repeat protein [Proteobacteria bacterium]|nr:tetratricopeptide repeat protein [Pseudomonadota bacterium]